MALNLATEYPANTNAADADYPQGSAKNVSSPTGTDGFPLEEAWLKDLEGFMQGLLYRASITPSGSPDTVLVSDYMDALFTILEPTQKRYYVDSTLADQGVATVEGNRSVKDHVDAIGATKLATLVCIHTGVATNTDYIFLTNETIPGNITIKFGDGARFAPATGIDATIYSPENIVAWKYQHIFTGAGNIKFTIGGEAFSAWAGGAGDFSTNCSPSVTALITALPEGKIILPQGRCFFEDEVPVNKSGINIEGGAGMGEIYAQQIGGTKVIPGTTMLSTEYIFKFSAGVNRSGLKSIYFIDENSDGTVTRNTEIAGCIYATGAQIRLEKLDFDWIKGSAIVTNDITKSFFNDIDIRGCGFTAKPALWLTGETQGNNFSALRLERCGGTSYFKIETTSSGNKISGVGFESQFAAVGTEDAGGTFLELVACERNIFSDFHFNQNDGATAGNPKMIVDVTSVRNTFSGFTFAGEREDYNLLIAGDQNIFTKLIIDNFAVITGTDNSILISGNYNEINGFINRGGNGYETVEVSGSENLIEGMKAIACAGQELNVTGNTNTIQTYSSDQSTLAASDLVSITGTRCILNGIKINNADTTAALVALAGLYNKLSDGYFYNNTSATAISITANKVKVSDCYFRDNADTIANTGLKCKITDNYNEDNDGADELISTDAQTLKHWGVTLLDSSGGVYTGTLGDGGYVGELKTVKMDTAGNNYDLSVTNHSTSDPEIIRFAAVGDIWIGSWAGTEWITIAIVGATLP